MISPFPPFPLPFSQFGAYLPQIYDPCFVLPCSGEGKYSRSSGVGCLMRVSDGWFFILKIVLVFHLDVCDVSTLQTVGKEEY